MTSPSIAHDPQAAPRSWSSQSRRWVTAMAAIACTVSCGYSQEWISGIIWPTPPIIQPGTAGGPPSDAIALFDGQSLTAWHNGDKWSIADGVATVRGGDISTKEHFGDCQLHIEWATPEKVEGSGQGRGNSGIFLMDRYEVQILDSYENDTYVDGQAGALYKTRPPMVNACRGPGQWQTYDILFTAPRFDSTGVLVKPAYVTVLHNGVAIHNHTEILGNTWFHQPPAYDANHPEKGPIRLQDHGNPMRFRNIWIRPLHELSAKYPG